MEKQFNTVIDGLIDSFRCKEKANEYWLINTIVNTNIPVSHHNYI
jgi:hypothetical protein